MRSDVDLDGSVTPVDSWSPCFFSSALILVLRASPVPSVDANLSAPAASLARICENGDALQQMSVFTFAHTDPYLGLDVDTPRAAALFGDCHYFDVGRYRACRARHRRLVFVLIVREELGLYAWVNHRLVYKIQARLQFLSCLTLMYGIVTVMVTKYFVSVGATTTASVDAAAGGVCAREHSEDQQAQTSFDTTNCGN